MKAKQNPILVGVHQESSYAYSIQQTHQSHFITIATYADDTYILTQHASLIKAFELLQSHLTRSERWPCLGV